MKKIAKLSFLIPVLLLVVVSNTLYLQQVKSVDEQYFVPSPYTINGQYCLDKAYTVTGTENSSYMKLWKIRYNHPDPNAKEKLQEVGNIRNKSDGSSVDINAMGFNQKNGFFYAITPDTSNGGIQRQLWKISTAGVAQSLGVLDGLPVYAPNVGGYYAADIKPGTPNYYVTSSNSSAIYKIDTSPGLSTSLERVKKIYQLSRQLEMNDFAFSTKDGYKDSLYGFDGATRRIVKITINKDNDTAEVENISEPLNAAGTAGSAWFYTKQIDEGGQISTKSRFFLYFSGTPTSLGDIYEIENVEQYENNNKFTGFQISPKKAPYVFRNDAASCAERDEPPADQDICPNIDGIQTEVPDGLRKDEDGNCVPVEPVYYPWLQTQKGDVFSTGGITGQELGDISDPTNVRGGRHYQSVSNKSLGGPEASFVIAAKENNGINFCSTMLYSLGITANAQQQSCSTGGYDGTGVNYGNIENALNNVWSKYGSGNRSASNNNCSPYITELVTTPNPAINLGCTNRGGLQKIEGNYSWNPNGQQISGRGTLWVNGDLTITGDIVYAPSGPVATPAQLPNLAIYATGKIIIDQSVRTVSAALIAKGGIESCAQASTAATACSSQLTTYGYWASAGKINFGRRYYVYNPANAVNNPPAELIVLTPQSVLYPPPGLSQGDGDINTELQINSGELPPRLN